MNTLLNILHLSQDYGWRPGERHCLVRVPQCVLPNKYYFSKGLERALAREMDLGYNVQSASAQSKPKLIQRSWGPGRHLVIQACTTECVRRQSWEFQFVTPRSCVFHNYFGTI